MGAFVEALDKGFDRILRFVYPGTLLVVLFHLFNPDLICKLQQTFSIWGVVVFAVVSGTAIFLVHFLVLNWLISIVFLTLGLLYEDKPRGCKARLADWADKWSVPTWHRWGINRDRHVGLKRANNWLTLRWSYYHAACMTLWITMGFLFWKGNWVLGLLPLLLLPCLFWEYLVLTRLALRLPKP